MMYSGIDLHSNNSVIAIIDDGDRVVAHKRLPNDVTVILTLGWGTNVKDLRIGLDMLGSCLLDAVIAEADLQPSETRSSQKRRNARGGLKTAAY